MDAKFRVKVEKREAARGAGMRIEGEITPEGAGLLWGRLLLRCERVASAGPPFGLRFEGGYAACWAIPPGYPLPEGLIECEAPAGWYAAAIHEGAYDRIDDTLRRMEEEWLPHSGFRRGESPLLERYLTDPREVPEAGLLSEICLPVEPDPIE